MSKKSFIISLVLSVIITFAAAFADAIFNRASIEFGLPFKFASASLFGEAGTDYFMLILDVLSWFIGILLVWKFILKRN